MYKKSKLGQPFQSMEPKRDSHTSIRQAKIRGPLSIRKLKNIHKRSIRITNHLIKQTNDPIFNLIH